MTCKSNMAVSEVASPSEGSSLGCPGTSFLYPSLLLSFRMRGRDAELKAKHKAAMHIKQEEGRYQSRPSTANGWDDGTFGRPPRSPLLVSHRSRRSSGASEGRPIVENDLRVESAGSTRQRPGALASEHAAKSAGRVSETLQQLKLREGFVGETSIVSSKAERKNEYDDEMKQINNLGARVDFLSRKLHATNANMQYVQYGALLKVCGIGFPIAPPL